eukprot:TRINITY_DN4053_c0_g2_i1.p1 TRINITY_DN4053_c0_g2~~TRINITY_DN4053_c0_g2_i1.p1  ORF type:complete len:467 (+),score=78.15 TRINITY_DN4053_c0_g2_i1:90-1490(+)
MLRSFRRAAAAVPVRAADYAAVNAVWRQTIQNESLRTIGRWDSLPDQDVSSHLVEVASLQPWWTTVEGACPLVASPTAEQALCTIRRHFTRLLTCNPAALMSCASSRESLRSLSIMATALSAQAKQSEYAYLVSSEERQWADRLSVVEEPALQPVAAALLPAVAVPPGDIEPQRGSDLVPSFYERDPIPQWTDLEAWQKVSAPLQEAGKAGKSVLVAGCGTGRWACHFAKAFPEAHVTAVDVSSSSISYAQQKKEQFQLENLNLRQQDLRTWSSAEQFDFIECGGVLHHLEDPVAAWAQLVSMLRPQGVMLVSLYSRAARLPLKHLRRDILPMVLPTAADKALDPSYQPDDETLRLFRRHLMEQTWTDEEFFQFARSPDFHSMSRLRDAMFHPLEHEYNLLEINRILDRLGLQFVGMDDDEAVELFGKAFREAAPQLLTNLQAWHKLEEKMPELFLGMYQLFVRKV